MRNEKGQFTKGNGGGGRKKLSKDLREVRHLALENFVQHITDVLKSTPEEIKKLDQEKLPMSHRTILNAFIKNDYRAIEYFLNRLWGKPKESIELSGGNELPLTINIIPMNHDNSKS